MRIKEDSGGKIRRGLGREDRDMGGTMRGEEEDGAAEDKRGG
jgi:hypothetical protein